MCNRKSNLSEMSIAPPPSGRAHSGVQSLSNDLLQTQGFLTEATLEASTSTPKCVCSCVSLSLRPLYATLALPLPPAFRVTLVLALAIAII